jgi:hypothetical protein
MTFQSLQNNNETSPAVDLHLRYGKLSIGKSKIADWRSLLQRGFTHSELDSLINWLEIHRTGAFPSSTTIVRNVKEMLVESKNDPVACRIKVSRQALDMWELICHAGCDIEPEFVQSALDGYREYLATCPPEFDFLDAPATFVHDWFVVRARYGSPRMRRFHLEHTKFKEYISLVKRAMERG